MPVNTLIQNFNNEKQIRNMEEVASTGSIKDQFSFVSKFTVEKQI